ncbi:MAG: LamB/YcsF family protein [Synergistaceae bacterium]|nr:LamB/YcsF family protein [Synergistaceae bacterium]
MNASDLKIDMNSDLGEGFGAWSVGSDKDVLRSVSSANIACGYHAGDPSIMRKTVKMCADSGVAVGAHVSYPDLVGFGRRKMECTPQEVYDYCVYQIGALAAFCKTQGVRIQHVKPHGALYNQAAKDRALADAVASAAADMTCDIILMGLAGSEFEPAAKAAGVKFAAEAFADRAYLKDGSLCPRSREGAVIHDAKIAAARVVRMVTQGTVTACDGTTIRFRPDTICLHGDTKEAVEMASAVRAALEAAGVKIVPLYDCSVA